MSAAVHPLPFSSRRRLLYLCLLTLPLGAAMAFIALGLRRLIDFFTQLFFFGRLSFEHAIPADHRLGWWVVFVPALGGLVIGLMARFGSKGIRGHGISEAIEVVLGHESRIPLRMTWLKPLSSAISIGSGGPFGPEGPIIATGSATGSLIGQLISTTAAERKTLLAAGAAAGMSAALLCPVSAVLLAVELLLFEFKPRSLIPVSIASAAAAAMRVSLGYGTPPFAMAPLLPASFAEMLYCLFLGAAVGAIGVGTTKAVSILEHQFERLPIHWMWWPALGALGIGLCGALEPRILGFGEANIHGILANSIPLTALFVICFLKFIAWSVALGSSTSGGTLAPLLTFGGGSALLITAGATQLFPALPIQQPLAGLVGMAALFTGSSQAMLASVAFGCEATGRLEALAPLLAGCTTALMTARFLSRHSIMSEKVIRSGLPVPSQFEVDPYAHTPVSSVMEHDAQFLPADTPLRDLLNRLAARDPAVSQRHAWLLTEPDGRLAGIVTRGDLLNTAEDLDKPLRRWAASPLIVTHPDESLQTAMEKMIRYNVGRLPVVPRDDPRRLVGYLGRAALLTARHKIVREESLRSPGLLRVNLRKV